MNKLEALISDTFETGQATLKDIMCGGHENRNLSPSVRAQLDSLESCPWIVVNGNLYWFRLVRSAGVPRLSGKNVIRWVLIRQGHLHWTLYQLMDLFESGGS
jgi:hypothetical protein